MANVHKDFHGALSFGVQYLQDNYGRDAMEEYLRTAGLAVYKPLIDALKEDGLCALAAHWARIFTLEEGDFDLSFRDGRLVLRVNKCPAIHHMKTVNYRVADRFCETTRIINEEICHAAGYECSTTYDQASGSCVQEFWRPEGGGD